MASLPHSCPLPSIPLTQLQQPWSWLLFKHTRRLDQSLHSNLSFSQRVSLTFTERAQHPFSPPLSTFKKLITYHRVSPLLCYYLSPSKKARYFAPFWLLRTLLCRDLINAKRLSEESLQMAEKREAKGKGEKERHVHLNAEFQRISRRDKKAFLSD